MHKQPHHPTRSVWSFTKRREQSSETKSLLEGGDRKAGAELEDLLRRPKCINCKRSKTTCEWLEHWFWTEVLYLPSIHDCWSTQPTALAKQPQLLHRILNGEEYGAHNVVNANKERHPYSRMVVELPNHPLEVIWSLLSRPPDNTLDSFATRLPCKICFQS